MSLQGKKIILAVTGSIAAYKTPNLVRLLLKAGAAVRVITTPSAADFVSPLSLATVSRQPVDSRISDGAVWHNHVAMGRWADALIIAPFTANTLAKLANGLCDNLVCAVYLSAVCPVFIAPAMDEDMWQHPATRRNIERVQALGNHHLLPVGHGELASGLLGEGRMSEPEEIVEKLADFFNQKQDLQGLRALVTAGPTYEKIDPVRFIGNYSSGKMGIALAEELAARGASVTLVLGPSAIVPAPNGIHTIRVESTQEMYDACIKHFGEADIAVLASAVADYKAAAQASEKIKKTAATFQLALQKTKDILATLGHEKKAGQILVGFALETHNELEHAQEKLVRKNVDLLVLNSLNDTGAGFGHDTNKVTLLDAAGQQHSLPLLPKKEVARTIINHILTLKNAQ
jgi:phosphopantothenoylcysteine decarboxylase/phosphopantothenate--cysteine ligase